MSDNQYFTTPVGRLVQGHPMEEQTTDHKNRPLTNQQGQPRSQYFFAIAISKMDPGVQAVIQAAQAEAQRGFPGGQHQLPTFAWKYIDGDAPEHKDKAGFAGCFIFKCTSGFAIKCFTKDGASFITDKDQIKRGYYCRASISWKANGETDKAGLYLNCNGFELFGAGEVIETGPSGSQMFGTAPAAVPTGVTAAPVATGPGMAPPAAQASPAAQTPPAAPGNFLNPAPPAPAMPHKVMTEKAQGVEYEAMIAAGWTDETLVAHGYMVIDDIPF